MQVKVFSEPEHAEPTLRLKLIDEGYGYVALVAVNSDGETLADAYILAVRSDGRIELFEGVSDKLGLKLTKDGYVTTVKG
jgi:hypothetical protein